MIRACLWLLAGAIAPQLSSFPRVFDHILGVIVALGIALTLVLPYLRRQDLCLFLAGTILFWASAEQRLAGRLDPRFEGDSMIADVRVVAFPRREQQSFSFLAAPIDDVRVPARISLNWQEPPVSIQPGDVWRLEIRLRRPRASSNPGAIDYEAWLFRERLAATGYVVGGKRNVLLDSDTSRGINRLREQYVQKVIKVLGDDAAVPVIVAVAIGARHLISKEAWDRYARTGTSHLMAISGLHIGLAAMAAYLLAVFVFGLIGRGNHHFAALLAGLLVALGYAALSGFAVPARRAIIMLACVTLVVLWRRETNSLRALALTTVIVIISDPISSMSPGFRLSFAAVAIILWTARRMQRPHISVWGRACHSVRGLMAMQILLLLGLMSLTITTFGRISLLAAPINLIAIPIFSTVTVPAVLLSLALPDAFAAPLAIALKIAATSIGWIEYLIGVSAPLPLASIYVARLEAAAQLIFLLPLIWVLLPQGWPGRYAAWLGAVALLVWEPGRVPAGCADIRALDVGQGLSVVVETRQHVLVYDAGPAWRNGGDAGERVVLPYLRTRGISHIDRLVVSHADLDHAGGAQSLLQMLSVSELIVGEPLPEFKAPSSPCVAGDGWTWDTVRFSFLHPQQSTSTSGNEVSCVLLIETGRGKALLTGDIEAVSEAWLVRRRVLPEVDIVTVPHHGSRTSSTGPFVRSLRPSIAIVSAGHNNRWGFPKPDVVARWRSTGADVLNTAESGSISIRLCAESGPGQPREWRNQRRRIWREVDS